MINCNIIPNGTPIVLTLDDGSEYRTKTRSNVWPLGSGQLVVLVEGKTGGWSIDRVRIDEASLKEPK